MRSSQFLIAFFKASADGKLVLSKVRNLHIIDVTHISSMVPIFDTNLQSLLELDRWFAQRTPFTVDTLIIRDVRTINEECSRGWSESVGMWGISW